MRSGTAVHWGRDGKGLAKGPQAVEGRPGADETDGGSGGRVGRMSEGQWNDLENSRYKGGGLDVLERAATAVGLSAAEMI